MAKPRHPRLRRAGLARAREAAGLTQEAFALRAGVEVSTVVRWESGCTTPLPGKRPRIARTLGIGLPELERLLSPHAPHVPAADREGTDDGRLAAIAEVREQVAKLTAEYDARPTPGLVVPASGLLARVEGLRGSAGGASDPMVVGDGRSLGRASGSDGGSLGLAVAVGEIHAFPSAAAGGPLSTALPGLPRPAVPRFPSAAAGDSGIPGPVLQPFVSVAAGDSSPTVIPGSPEPATLPFVDAATCGSGLPWLAVPPPAAPIRWRRDLDIAEAEAALLIGRLLWDAAGRRDSSAAEEYFDLAVRRAGQAGDVVLQVTAALRAGFVGLYGGDPRAGVRRCVQAAVIAAPVSEALFALARLHAAEGHALLGHASECDRALATARGAMAAIGPDDPAPDVCPPRTYQRLAGSAHLALGRYAQARVALTDAAIRHEPGKVLAVVLGRLALACLGEGDTDAALRHVRTAIELAEATRSAGALAVAFRAGREIVRSADGMRPEVREIVDLLLNVPVRSPA